MFAKVEIDLSRTRSSLRVTLLSALSASCSMPQLSFSYSNVIYMFGLRALTSICFSCFFFFFFLMGAYKSISINF